MFFSFQFVFISSVLINWATAKSYIFLGRVYRQRKEESNKIPFLSFHASDLSLQSKKKSGGLTEVTDGMRLKTAQKDSWFR